jgi:uncharacterized protein YjiS (DUF1127 family)
MNIPFPTPLTQEDINGLQRRAADMRAAAYRDAFVAIGRFARFLAASLVRRIEAAVEAQRVADELGAMSDRDLADIGLTRSDLSPRRIAEIGEDATLARNEGHVAEAEPANQNFRRAA